MHINKRIGILDGFRAIAIIAVLLFHFYSRYTPRHEKSIIYPYGAQYDYFGLGNMGVQFFFIISGFVIFYTLDLTNTFTDFWKKRLIRLYPTLVIISFFLFLFFHFFDTNNIFPDIHKARNLEFSLTFINPVFFNILLHHWHPSVRYLNGSFWSLWYEIQFYVFVSILYYHNKQKFIKNFLIITLFVLPVNWVMCHMYYELSGYPLFKYSFAKNLWYWAGVIFTLPTLLNNLVHFALGVIYYILYQEKHNGSKPSLFTIVTLFIFIFFQCESGNGIYSYLLYLAMDALFLCFIYFPDKLHFLEDKYITGIGVDSYVTYLFHEPLGVFLIYTFGSYFMPYGFIFPILLIFLFLFIAHVYNQYVDLKVSKFLKRKLLK